jgi:pyruvate dehydrogenase E1 component
MMTVYDFFIKRALDQYFYNLYWKSSFILVGTPAGVTLSPEGAQHGWKSDFQIPNQITWEPFFCVELDWILTESIRRHIGNDNEGRTGVLIRCVTRGVEQKDMMSFLKRQARFKQSQESALCRAEFPIDGSTSEDQVPSIDEAEIMQKIRQDVLKGAYYLVDYRGYAGFEPGDNVVNIFSMGSPTTEALKASEKLLAMGIYANVIVVTSPDLLCGILGHESEFSYLRNDLNINGDLIVRPQTELNGHEFVTVSGKRVPIVSVHDGEIGLLDNLGSIVGVRQEALAVVKHSKCGKPSEVYKYHHIDEASIIEACGKVLSETALEEVKVSRSVLGEAELKPKEAAKWTDLWPLNPERRH